MLHDMAKNNLKLKKKKNTLLQLEAQQSLPRKPCLGQMSSCPMKILAQTYPL